MDRSASHYTATAIGLHWLMAVLLVTLFCVGLYMHELPLSPWKLHVYSWHKWAGVTALLVLLVRLAWRARHRPPELPASMAPAARLATHAGHGLLYVLVFAIALSGWLMSSAKGFQTVYLGVLPIPDLLDKNKALGEALQQLHQALNFLLAALVAAHAAAAVKHHLFDKDDVLTRMLPRRG
ncbi:Cytochrome B561 [Burkholderiales bacterium]|nr:Cytochrome B561 [Burkholderiales bacterium]